MAILKFVFQSWLHCIECGMYFAECCFKRQFSCFEINLYFCLQQVATKKKYKFVIYLKNCSNINGVYYLKDKI